MDRTTPPPENQENQGQRTSSPARRRHTLFTPQSYAFGSRSGDATSSSTGQEQALDPALDGIPLRPRRADSWQAQQTNNWQVESSFQPSAYFGNLDPHGELRPEVYRAMRENEHSEQNRKRLNESAKRVKEKLKLEGEIEIPIQTKKNWQDFMPVTYNTLKSRYNLDEWNSTLLWDMLNGGIHYPDVKPEDRDTEEYKNMMDEMLTEWYTGPGKPK